jgi:hypothetical protein
MPSSILVGADPAALEPGEYSGAVLITSDTASPPLRVVNVSFRVHPAPAPQLAAEGDLTFVFAPGSEKSVRQVVITNRGSGTIAFSAQSPARDTWLSVSPAGGSVTLGRSVVLNVMADPATLSQGTYTSSIVVSSADRAQSIAVPVTVIYGTGAPSLALTQSGLTFTVAEGNRASSSQIVGVLNYGSGQLKWNAEAGTFPPGQSWLTVSPGEGTSGPDGPDGTQAALMRVSVTPGGLTAGTYGGQVTVSSLQAPNSPQLISVVLNVVRSPFARALPEVRPTGLVFVETAGRAPSGSQEVEIFNFGDTATSFVSSVITQDGLNWLTRTPAQGTVSPERPATLLVQADATRLDPGVRRGFVTL